MLNNDDRAGIEEQYSQACTSSQLRVEAEKRGSADLLIAAGWSPSRVGAALLRLHTEYDRAGLSRAPSQTDLRLLIGKLKSLADVRREATRQANTWRMVDPESTVIAVVLYWLDQRCKACGGLGAKAIPGTPVLHAKPCHKCRGSGKTITPYGDDGKRLANYFDDCVSKTRQSMKKRLHNNHNPA